MLALITFWSSLFSMDNQKNNRYENHPDLIHVAVEIPYEIVPNSDLILFICPYCDLRFINHESVLEHCQSRHVKPWE